MRSVVERVPASLLDERVPVVVERELVVAELLRVVVPRVEVAERVVLVVPEVRTRVVVVLLSERGESTVVCA